MDLLGETPPEAADEVLTFIERAKDLDTARASAAVGATARGALAWFA